MIATNWTPLPLVVSAAGGGQFIVKRAERRIPPSMAWDQYYVEFSGYFGHHGPHVFAAAPELVEALRDAEIRLRGAGMLGGASDPVSVALDRVRNAR